MAAVWLKRVKQLDRLPGTIRLRIYQRNKYTAMYMCFIPASQLSLPTIRLEQVCGVSAGTPQRQLIIMLPRTSLRFSFGYLPSLIITSSSLSL